MVRQDGNGAAAWRALLLLGVLLNGIGLVAGIPLLPLVGLPVALVGLIGTLAAKRKAS
ncbi:hypothetical protein [Saccharothrix hoggarensis]|uniref:Secreted protein with PEP-CTERM sorting signal n=1 Tax=Saccharothrix hoggarensis TaxID=913853 RepID=A0ABW3R4S3_9PSEU